MVFLVFCHFRFLCLFNKIIVGNLSPPTGSTAAAVAQGSAGAPGPSAGGPGPKAPGPLLQWVWSWPLSGPGNQPWHACIYIYIYVYNVIYIYITLCIYAYELVYAYVHVYI